MRLPFVSRARYDAAHAEANRLRAERDAALKDADTWYHTATRTSELYVDTSLVNACLTEDLTAARARLAEHVPLADYEAEKRRVDKPKPQVTS